MCVPDCENTINGRLKCRLGFAVSCNLFGVTEGGGPYKVFKRSWALGSFLQNTPNTISFYFLSHACKLLRNYICSYQVHNLVNMHDFPRPASSSSSPLMCHDELGKHYRGGRATPKSQSRASRCLYWVRQFYRLCSLVFPIFGTF